MRTTYNGNVDGSFSSLPFGDGYTVSGTDRDPYHFAMMDKDYYDGYDSGMEHAQFRQYSETPGRWMSPDPYSGSYDFSNPQSLNRYSYVLNNPFAFTDPSGLDPCSEYGGEGGNCSSGGGDNGLIGFLAQVAHDIAGLFAGGPSFHGSLKPRPNSQPWDEYHIHYGPDIADAFGLPDPGCDFGACGGGGLGFTNGTLCRIQCDVGRMNQTEENWLMSTVVGASILYIEATDYIHQMSKGGKTGVGHDYVRDMARSLGGDYCSALKSIRDAARKRGDSKLFNDAKATYKQDCRGYGN